MPLYNYKPRFVPYIQDGSKFHTIRAIRKHPCRVGDMMYHYTGLRTKYAKKIIEPTHCTAALSIFIYPERIFLADVIMNIHDSNALLSRPVDKQMKDIKQVLSGYELTTRDKCDLAFNDGFRFTDEDTVKLIKECEIISTLGLFLRFWNQTHQLPFIGHLNCWHKEPHRVAYIQNTCNYLPF